MTVPLMCMPLTLTKIGENTSLWFMTYNIRIAKSKNLTHFYDAITSKLKIHLFFICHICYCISKVYLYFISNQKRGIYEHFLTL